MPVPAKEFPSPKATVALKFAARGNLESFPHFAHLMSVGCFIRGTSLTLDCTPPTIIRLLDTFFARSGAHAMDKKRLENYKKKLQSKREDLVRNIARVEEEGRAADVDTTVDLADKAANSYTKEFLFGQTNAERAFLQLIDDSLKRIKAGDYGQCAN